MIIATTRGIAPDGRAYVVGASLDGYSEKYADWVQFVLNSGGARDDTATAIVPAAQVASASSRTPPPSVIKRAADLKRKMSTEAQK